MYYTQCFVEMEMFTYLQIIFEWAVGKSLLLSIQRIYFPTSSDFPMKKKNMFTWSYCPVAYLTQ